MLEPLSNTYGIATVFDLDPDQTRQVSPVARALTGNQWGAPFLVTRL